MRTDQERIILLHKRAGEIQKQTERMYMRLWGIASAALFICLTGITVALSGRAHGIAVETAAGSSMLSETAGGYLLAALLSFMFGVMLTAFLVRRGPGSRKKIDALKSIPEISKESNDDIQEDEQK